MRWLARAALLGIAACASAAPTMSPRDERSSHALLGKPAPSLEGDAFVRMGAGDSGKTKLSLARWKGKVVLVDFWATWCEPCKKSFPKLEALRVKWNASGVEVVGVSEDDDPSSIREFAATHGANFPIMWDKGKSIAGRWRPPNMPTTFVVDKKGVVRFLHLGYHEVEETEIDNEVKSLL
ncbi:thioredoxin family protein [Labilithrix luteola]|uniref:Thioredoxin family protein n=1 Tax=Labilithrix luteola TaxID=1391654 RepID=A0A0K1QD53_9BACT|nr:TlpA disulfide reductase family protein [Labilithrix luteola]AKV03679.1 thioredoxin family protein [Labilithrix luteola]